MVTHDPRGSERSTREDPTTSSSPEEHANDVYQIIQAIGGGPVDIFASSGGAVNALALVADHPGVVRTLVAHEPPVAALLADAAEAKAAIRAVRDTYQASGWGAGMAHFITLIGHKGPITDDVVAQPAPDPALFGMPAEDDGNRTDVLFGQNLITCTHFEPDIDALRRASTRIVAAAGIESEGEMAYRGAVALAEVLGTDPVIFPSNHGGFLGGEYGQTGDPDAFAAKLGTVLADEA
ncbi:MAG TPA: alpha/beta hydrolase [Acidimicrobiia bacterium]|nr:alpha/beta hydrolase [Acidimicrobiia bacterium]